MFRDSMEERLIELTRLALRSIDRISATLCPETPGGYLHISTGFPLLILRVGTPPERPEHLIQVAEEQAHRLQSKPYHKLSWQSRKPKSSARGGALRTEQGVIFSFAGMPELINEAFCASLVHHGNLEHIEYLKRSMEISNNLENYRICDHLVGLSPIY